MQKRFWSIWLVIELAFILLVLLAWPVHASPIWECESQAGWTMSPNGDVSELPVTSETSIIEFQPPNKMKPIKTGNAFDKKIYETMRYKVFQNHYFGYGMVKDGVFKLSVSEVLSDTESTFTAIFESGPKTAIVKQSKCERVM